MERKSRALDQAAARRRAEAEAEARDMAGGEEAEDGMETNIQVGESLAAGRQAGSRGLLAWCSAAPAAGAVRRPRQVPAGPLDTPTPHTLLPRLPPLPLPPPPPPPPPPSGL